MDFRQGCIKTEFRQHEIELAFPVLPVIGFGVDHGGQHLMGIGLLLGGELDGGCIGMGHSIQTESVELIHSSLTVH